MTTRRHGPLIPLYLAYSPELLLLARCLWYREDAVRAALLVDALKLPLLAAPLFQALTSPACPRFETQEWPEIKEWVRSRDPALLPVLERVVEIPMPCVDLAALTECVQMLERGRVMVDDPRHEMPRWQRDLASNVLSVGAS